MIVKFRRISAIVAALVVVLISAILAHGYWHTVTHGVVYIDVRDSSGIHVRHPGADVAFLDMTGQVLAQYATDSPSGGFYVSRPVTYSCREIEKRAPFEARGHEAYRECGNGSRAGSSHGSVW